MAENANPDVSELVAFMANTSMDEEFDGLTESARASALAARRRWLRAENHAAAVDESFDMPFFVGCTSVPVWHSLVWVSVTLDEVLCTGAGLDDGLPNGKQKIYARTYQKFPNDFWPDELKWGPTNLSAP